MNPWDTKLTHELTQSELRDFCHHLDMTGALEREALIGATVDRAVAWWTNKRGDPQWLPGDAVFREHVRARTGAPWWGENAMIPANSYSTSYTVIEVLLPDWLQSDFVPYLAEMQVREQWERNEEGQ